MEEDANIPGDLSKGSGLPNPEEDGRNREWQDRARVNMEQVPEGTQSNVERDFEPENPGEEKHKKGKGEKDGSEY